MLHLRQSNIFSPLSAPLHPFFCTLIQQPARRLVHLWGTSPNDKCHESGASEGSTSASKEGGHGEPGQALALPEMSSATRTLADGVLAGHKSSLSRAITLCESSRGDHRGQAAALLQHLVSVSNHVADGHMFRVGITGPPGAGKSSLIERLGMLATGGKEKVAVLAVDPSSDRTGGAILGDKTRMEQLAHEPRAFVRPSPSGGHAGGVARATADAALLCEAKMRKMDRGSGEKGWRAGDQVFGGATPFGSHGRTSPALGCKSPGVSTRCDGVAALLWRHLSTLPFQTPMLLGSKEWPQGKEARGRDVRGSDGRPRRRCPFQSGAGWGRQQGTPG